VKTPLKTSAARDAAMQLLDNVAAEPSEGTLEALRSIWRTLEERMPRARTRAAAIDPESSFRARVAKALFAVALEHVTDSRLRSKLIAAKRKERPTSAEIAGAVTAIDRHLEKNEG
jgi:hypothetical protein